MRLLGWISELHMKRSSQQANVTAIEPGTQDKTTTRRNVLALTSKVHHTTLIVP